MSFDNDDLDLELKQELEKFSDNLQPLADEMMQIAENSNIIQKIRSIDAEYLDKLDIYPKTPLASPELISALRSAELAIVQSEVFPKLVEENPNIPISALILREAQKNATVQDFFKEESNKIKAKLTDAISMFNQIL